MAWTPVAAGSSSARRSLSTTAAHPVGQAALVDSLQGGQLGGAGRHDYLAADIERHALGGAE